MTLRRSKTKDLLSSATGISRIAMKYTDMATVGSIPGVQISDGIRTTELHAQGKANEIKKAVQKWWDGL